MEELVHVVSIVGKHIYLTLKIYVGRVREIERLLHAMNTH